VAKDMPDCVGMTFSSLLQLLHQVRPCLQLAHYMTGGTVQCSAAFSNITSLYLFSSDEFSLFNSIKSITSPRDLMHIELVVVQYIQILVHKDSVHKVTIVIKAGNKMSLMYGYLSD
jgi:hypothetical protein